VAAPRELTTGSARPWSGRANFARQPPWPPASTSPGGPSPPWTGTDRTASGHPRLIDKLRDFYDVVSGSHDRQDPFWSRRLPSQVANGLISCITGVSLHDYGCALKVYRREILQDVALYGEMHRFLPALCHWVGATVGELPVGHAPRRRGISKYGLGRTVRVLLDLLTVKFLMSYWTRPIQIFGLLGLVLGGGLATAAARTKIVLGSGRPIARCSCWRSPRAGRLSVRVDRPPGRDARPHLSRVKRNPSPQCERSSPEAVMTRPPGPVVPGLASPSCRRRPRAGRSSSARLVADPGH
jgi:hypothetical protein